MRFTRVAALAVALFVLVNYVRMGVANGFGSEWGIGLSILGTGLLGALLLFRRPDNRMGWVFAIAGMAGTAAGFAEVGTNLPYWAFASSTAGWLTWIFATFVLIPLRFPTGEISTPRMRWVGRVATAILLAMVMMVLFQERACVEVVNDTCARWLDNPIGIAGVSSPEEGLVGNVLLLILVAAAGAAIVSLLARFRKTADVERHQIKWLFYTVTILVGWVITVDLIAYELFGFQLTESIANPVVGLLWLGIPVSAGLAIFKYKLYEIDRIVSRTVTYALVIGMLVAAYAGGVALFTEVLPLEGNLGVAASTLVVAALFNPLRRHLQAIVDRHFNRSRYDVGLTVDALTARLRDVTDVPAVIEAGGWAVATTVQPMSMSIWVRET